MVAVVGSPEIKFRRLLAQMLKTARHGRLTDSRVQQQGQVFDLVERFPLYQRRPALRLASWVIQQSHLIVINKILRRRNQSPLRIPILKRRGVEYHAVN